MKLTVKTLKGQQFEVHVEPSLQVVEVKKKIEEVRGRDHFPHEQQKLIHQGKVLKDDTTLADNNVTESGFVVVMVVQPKHTAPAASSAPRSAAATPSTAAAPAAAAAVAAPAAAAAAAAPEAAPAAAAPAAATEVAAPSTTGAAPEQPAPAAAAASAEASPAAAPAAPAPAAAPDAAAAAPAGYGSAASALVAGSALESTVAQILEMGGGSWDRATVLRALRAAFNNPERAVEYLYSGIPDHLAGPAAPAAPAASPAAAAAAPAAGVGGAVPAGAAAGAAPPSAIPNVAPLDLFGQVTGGGGGGGGGAAAVAGDLDFLRTNPQFRALRAMVQANPQLLQPMLQELGKQNPQLLQLINAHQMDFLRLLNESATESGEGEEGSDMLEDALGEAAAAAAAGQAIQVTPEEAEAISRLEAMGFDRQLVLQAYFACDKNEQLAANYLLEHGAEFFDD